MPLAPLKWNGIHAGVWVTRRGMPEIVGRVLSVHRDRAIVRWSEHTTTTGRLASLRPRPYSRRYRELRNRAGSVSE